VTTNTLDNLERATEAVLAREESVTPERIRVLISQMRALPMFEVNEEEAELLARRLETRHDVTMNLGSHLKERGFKPWLESALAGIDPYYWDRYKKLLAERHFSPQVLGTLHADTNRTLGLLENPAKPGPWNRRGMVVGHVQSGKTANYIGLICKAADAGYRLVVVIAGVHNNLRNQTQKRIDEGFVGRDSAALLSLRENKYVGVGRYDARRRPVTFTNSIKDFSKDLATGVGVPLQNLNEPAVFVIKKNSSTLKNLLDWLREHNASRGTKTVDTPMLLIDDEADNASINVQYGRDEVSRINGQIRDLLQMFTRSCYVGYTATPFANIFIDPDTDDAMRGEDLFPRHFIVSLDPPTNYFGADRVFLTDGRPVVRHIDDNEELLPLKHVITHVVSALPASLIAAVRAFVVARAIRLLRGHRNQHCSMLVNASRFTGVQGQIRTALQRLLDDIQASVRLNAGLPCADALRDPELAALKSVWDVEFANSGQPWSEVQGELLEAVSPIKVVEVNSRSYGTLNYNDYEDTGLNVIAVGGFSLSRGLTLEGLMVSYFLRNSMMYDTLMQMGRWFGYRPEYEDLCRVWMPEEAEGWYAHVAESIEMLREEFRQMAAAGATPEEFGLKVRAHPDTLIVTARNKMGSGERVVVSIGLDNEFIETSTVRNDETARKHNGKAVLDFSTELAASGRPLTSAKDVSGGWLLRDVPVKCVRNFIAAYANHPRSIVTDSGPVGRYIEAREETELATWDVLFAGLSKGAEAEGFVVHRDLGIPIICQQRTAGPRSDENTLTIGSRQRVASRGVEKTGLSSMDIADAEREYREQLQRDNKPTEGRLNYPDRIYRSKRPRPLLIVHLLQVFEDPDYTKRLHDIPVVAWSISFPRSERPEQRVEYIVTTTWMREHFRDELDEDESEPQLG
jgi:hypothetical protein